MCCLAHTPVQLSTLLQLLVRYPNRKAADTLRSGFTVGFRLGFSGQREARDAPNLLSVKQAPTLALDKLMKEVDLGRMAGPFSTKPIENLRISPIGLVPKAEPGTFRLIHHLSYPDSDSVNSGIDRQLCTVQYTSFDEAVSMIAGAGPGALLAKADIQSAFRLIPIHPNDFCLLGIKVSDKIFVDKTLPMGASCAPAYFETFSTFIEWAVSTCVGLGHVRHYVDDFLFASGASVQGSQSCRSVLNCFVDLCAELGVPLAHDKTIEPTTKLTFLGLEINTVSQSVAIPQDKLPVINGKIATALRSEKITLKNLQSLIGSLSFVCRAVPPGRAFLRRLIDLSKGVKKPWHLIRLSKGAKDDLHMWQVFLHNFNGSTIIPDQFWLLNEDLQLFTDASSTIGFGGYFQGQWFNGVWPLQTKVSTPSIAWLEFFPVVVALTLWGQQLKGKRILIRSDNAAVVSIVNTQSSKCPRIMNLVRFFVLKCLNNNVSFRARHIPGVKNDIADALSRSQMTRFRALAPQAANLGSKVPPILWSL